jgi:hypothetical protein
MADPLCPGLYELLKLEFGDVAIANEGASLDAQPRWDPVLGRIEWDVQSAGEYYRVNCPYCTDDRKRLWFNHCYGQVDQETGRTANWMVVCYNEGCLQGNDRRAVENREDLEIRLFRRMQSRSRNDFLTVRPGRPEDNGPPPPAELPGEVVTLDLLSSGHPAVAYVAERGYDPYKLGRKYGVGFCARAFEYRQAQGRLIIPIVQDGVLVGWQGRFVGDTDFKRCNVQKYYNLPGMKRSKMLYNWDRARRGRVLVIVEGVTSVWTVGDAGMALLGKTFSAYQKARIESLAGEDDRPRLLVLMLDPDVEENYKGAQKLASAFGDILIPFAKRGGASLRVRLPKGKDPGNYSHEAIWDMIYATGDVQGVDVDGFLD